MPTHHRKLSSYLHTLARSRRSNGNVHGRESCPDIPGSLPGTLRVTSDVPPEITLIDYSPTDCVRRELSQPAEILPYLASESVSWVDVKGLGNEPVLQQLGQVFGLHPLVLEDVVNVPQRPNVEDHEQQLVLIARMAMLREGESHFFSEQVSFVLGPHYLLTVQEEPAYDCFAAVRDRLRTAKGPIRRLGSDYLLYSLLDAIIDGFFPVLEAYGEELELLEARVVTNPSPTTLEAIHRIKRELLTLRRILWPQRDAINSLIRDGSELISPEVQVYLRDCYDHTVQVLDMVETCREVASSLMDVYLSAVGNRMNEIMKVLTVMSSIFIPLTFIAGVYGMNFDNMPELRDRNGYFICLAVMALLALVLIAFFWRQGWVSLYGMGSSTRPVKPTDG
jgi:magnesium transporter